MNGLLQVENGKFSLAVQSLVHARSAYKHLAELRNDELFVERLASIEPSIRYCQYFLGEEKNIDLASLSSKSEDVLGSRLQNILKSASQESKVGVETVKFCGKEIAISVEVQQALQENGDDLQSSGRALVAWETLSSSLRKEIERLAGTKNRTPESIQQEATNVALLEFVEYNRLRKLLNRTVRLAEAYTEWLENPHLIPKNSGYPKKIKFDDLVGFYDKLVQISEEFVKHPGLAGDRPQLQSVEELNKSSKIKRLFYRAEGYCSLQCWAESYVLYERVIEMSRSVPQCENLISQCESKKLIALANAFLHEREEKDDVPLVVDKFNQFHIGESLKPGDLSSRFIPIECRPVLYDLANEHIQFKDLSERLKQKKSIWSFWK